MSGALFVPSSVSSPDREEHAEFLQAQFALWFAQFAPSAPSVIAGQCFYSFEYDCMFVFTE